MKLQAWLCGFLLPFTFAAGQAGERVGSYVPVRGCVPDAATAVKIAEAVLIPVYGEKQIVSERPFHATLKDDVWTVDGTLTCPDGKGGTTTICIGGAASVKLSKRDARILFMIHYK
jgi:hypothetical protein